MIEVELRSFIDKDKYDQLVQYFLDQNIEINTQKQITYYFSGEQDFRMMITKEYCQLWLKKGKLHDDAREEIVVKLDKNSKSNLLNMLVTLGFETQIKWFRERKSLVWSNVSVTLDYTDGYGYIVEMEILAEDDKDVENQKSLLRELFLKLDINIVEKKVFTEKYEDYKVNWMKYTDQINEESFLQ